MKVLIHDLGTANKIDFEKSFDYVINADGKYAPCQGCFNCWTKHPAECYMKDSLKEVCRVIGRADEKATFEYMAERNAINYGYKQSEVIVLESLSELEEMF